MSAKRVVVVGGGISGLAAAHRLSELADAQNLPLDITLLEASPRFGGVIETWTQNGCLLEGGPDSLISEKPWALDLCKRLGLHDEIIPTQEAYRQSYILRNGKLVRVPKGFYLLASGSVWTLLTTQLLGWVGKLRMALEPLIPAKRHTNDESVGGFVRRRFGQEALDRIGQPMIGGIYMANPNKLSLQATFPRFQEMEREFGSVVRAFKRTGVLRTDTLQQDKPQGDRAQDACTEASGPRYSLFLSLRNGIGALVDALLAHMPAVTLAPGRPARGMQEAGPKGTPSSASWRITLEDGEVLEADAVCLALPAFAAARLTTSCAPELSELLNTIPYESVATVNVVFKSGDVPVQSGFGFVVPAVEKRGIVGCTFSSIKYEGRAPDACILLRAFVGGALDRDRLELSDAEIETMVLREFKSILGIMAKPEFVAVRRHPDSMPQYHVGHMDRVKRIEAETDKYPGLYLTGNAYHGVGIPDCIHHAEQMAERLLMSLRDPIHVIASEAKQSKVRLIASTPFGCLSRNDRLGLGNDNNPDHVLIIGFGGPTKPEEIPEFLTQVSRGRKIPEARLKEVARHYELIGGKSPYNECAFRFRDDLARVLGDALAVFVGMRNWHPFLRETLAEIEGKGFKKGMGVILSPFRSTTSCDRYKKDVEGAGAIPYEFLPTWSTLPDFIEAQATVVKQALEKTASKNKTDVPIVFTAHSIPASMLDACDICSYPEEFKTSASLVAKAVGHEKWQIAYQSRSGNLKDPWLEPDVLSMLKVLRAKGEREVVLVPIGFLCDNAEILYDLDLEAREAAEQLGLRLHRAATVLGEQRFVRMIADLVSSLCDIPEKAGIHLIKDPK